MNQDRYKIEALTQVPKIEIAKTAGLRRHEIVNQLIGNQNTGIELGVATGLLSKRFVESGKFKSLFGVDVYGDVHDTEEYKNAIKLIGIDSNHKILRLTFDDALGLFPDEYFDFIYVDGFAHTGEEGGKTLVDWYGKLKIGGIMSGDDYHEDWPLVIWAVNHFASQLDVQITLTDLVMDESYSKYPSWFFIKQNSFNPHTAPLDPRLVEIAQKEKTRIHNLRTSTSSLKFRILRFIKRLIFNPGFFIK
ncbi:MAG: class I SAM-dependent methyltransferase [Burkholderiaceae bacterium]|jgi:hypothetical protein|nr:class I SAM-dependent methyltransferase [Burkholderiaceae bacterium]